MREKRRYFWIADFAPLHPTASDLRIMEAFGAGEHRRVGILDIGALVGVATETRIDKNLADGLSMAARLAAQAQGGGKIPAGAVPGNYDARIMLAQPDVSGLGIVELGGMQIFRC